jgi:OmpA-OmpF porin, OOP family
MKKILMFFAFASLAISSMAQDELSSGTSQMKYGVSTNSFWSNWFVQANASFSAFYMDEDYGKGLSESPFKSFRHDFGASFAIGKWFTPALGLRIKINGVWGKMPYLNEKMKYWNLQEQVLFNLSNMIYGYSDTRVWNFIPYMGFGTLRDCSIDRYAMGYSVGILNTFKINRHIMLNFDINLSGAEKDFDGIHDNLKSTYFKSKDHIVSAEVGVTFNIGKSSWDKTPDVDAIQTLNQGQIDAMSAQLADVQDENTKLQELVDSKSGLSDSLTEVIEKKDSGSIATIPLSIFFNVNELRVVSRRELLNVKTIVNFAKANGSEIVVTGYADSKTGQSQYNKNLSQKRADAIANELVKMGVKRSKIQVVAAGETNDLSPFDYNRRVTIEIK